MSKAPAFAQQVTFLYTADLGATARFYEYVLGLELVLDQGTCRIYRVARDAFVGFCQRVDPPAAASLATASLATASIILTLVTDDVDGWHRRLSECGVAFAQPPAYNATYNIYHCFLRDPNGYLLEIQSFRDPRWPAP